MIGFDWIIRQFLIWTNKKSNSLVFIYYLIITLFINWLSCYWLINSFFFFQQTSESAFEWITVKLIDYKFHSMTNDVAVRIHRWIDWIWLNFRYELIKRWIHQFLFMNWLFFCLIWCCSGRFGGLAGSVHGIARIRDRSAGSLRSQSFALGRPGRTRIRRRRPRRPRCWRHRQGTPSIYDQILFWIHYVSMDKAID